MVNARHTRIVHLEHLTSWPLLSRALSTNMRFASLELDTVDNQNAQKSSYRLETELPTSEDRDVHALARLGKKPVLLARSSQIPSTLA